MLHWVGKEKFPKDENDNDVLEVLSKREFT